MKSPDRWRRRILVVDDEEMIRELLERLLRSKGYEVVSAKDAAEARNHMTYEDFDLILEDTGALIRECREGAEVDKGTGLGLNVAYPIVKKHGGSIAR